MDRGGELYALTTDAEFKEGRADKWASGNGYDGEIDHIMSNERKHMMIRESMLVWDMLLPRKMKMSHDGVSGTILRPHSPPSHDFFFFSSTWTLSRTRRPLRAKHCPFPVHVIVEAVLDHCLCSAAGTSFRLRLSVAVVLAEVSPLYTPPLIVLPKQLLTIVSAPR